MNSRVYIDFNNKAVAAEEAKRFSGILVMSACCCLCCIKGTGGHFSCK